MKAKFTLMFTVLLSVILTLSAKVEGQTNCITPTSLTSSNIGASTAQLTWTLAMTSSYSNLRYRPAGSASWSIAIVQQLPYTLGNLSCNTVYEWQVQAVCANSGTSNITSPFSTSELFTTLSCNTTCPIPSNLSVNNVTATGAVLTWSSVAPSAGTLYNIQYHSTSSSNWTTINNVSGNNYQLTGLSCNTPYVIQVQTVCFNNSTGVTTLSPWSPLFTFITAGCNNTCIAPTNLGVSNVTGNSALLSWTSVSPAPGTIYNIQYQTSPSTTWININNVTTTSYQLNGLACNTVYIFRVQSVCLNTVNNTTTLSPWSQLFTFITPACNNSCPAPTGLISSNVSSISAVLSWNTSTPSPLPNTFNIRYRKTSTAAWLNINNIGSPYQLSGLQCNSPYEWQVQAICIGTNGTTTLSPWSQSSFFTTLACQIICPAPTGLTTNNITSFSAFTIWNPVAGATNYSLRYRAVGSLAWTNINSSVNYALIVNLICGVQYEWQVRSFCSPVINNSVNPYSAPVIFTTLSCNTSCLPPTGLTSSNITANSVQLAWNTNGAPMYRVRYRISSSGMLWIYQNTAATSIAINGLQPASTYEWQVQSICSQNSNSAGSPWSALAGFQTLQPAVNSCAPPTGLTATAMSQQGGILTWNAVVGAIMYNVRYKPINSTLPYVTATATTNFIQIGNLTPGSVYEWQVQTVCVNSATGVTTLSPWSAIGVFTTPMLVNIYPNPANEAVKISLFTDDPTLITYELRDMFGKSMISGALNSIAGMNEFEIQTNTIFNGWYSLTVNTPMRTSSSRVLIKH